MSGPIPLSATDFAAVLEAAGVDPGDGSVEVSEPEPGAEVGAWKSGADDIPTSIPTPLPDPFDDADALDELEHEVITLSAHIEAATFRLLVLIADFDRRRGWELGGHRSCAHWLH